MNARFYLDTRKAQRRKKGFPICVSLTKDQEELRFIVKKGLVCELEDWDFEKLEPKTNKTNILYLRKLKAKFDLLVSEITLGKKTSLKQAKNILLGKEEDISSRIDFFGFSKIIVNELSEKVDEKGVQKKGNLRAYENAIKQLKVFQPSLKFEEINYNLLNKFITWQTNEGNKKSTINTYLRKYRAIYNQAVKRGYVKDLAPFKDVLKEVYVKNNRTKNRHINKRVIFVLENLSGLVEGQQIAVDFWLLQFYFGGQDFKDIYFLENNQIAKNRVYFRRGKLDDGGYQFDLKLFDKALKIFKKYKCKGQYVFPWRKDYDGYKTFLRRAQKNLVTVQNNYNKTCLENERIEVLPLGGNLSPKVARHSFSTIATRLFIEPDLLRQLMGHERDDVDTIYKDKFPEEVRDEWHYKIIHQSYQLTRSEAIKKLKESKDLLELEIISKEDFEKEKEKMLPFII